MQFSSLIFLFLFLPLTLLFYYLSPKFLKNYLLLVASLIFFAWGGVSFTLILIFSIIFNYLFGRALEKLSNTKGRYYVLVAGVAFNLLLLGIFKYANFVVENINVLFNVLFIQPIANPGIALPVGISFYTFHALSYLIDIYRGKTKAQRNIFNLALYIAMFSQLIAGPIVRYSDVWLQLTERMHTANGFYYGIKRFIIGLSKKILLANCFAEVADKVFGSNLADLSTASAWLGIVCYTLQIYFDFSGYSDMAIGLGHMFGFDFKENFNLPYSAKSVKEFWRRWHISLSTFFRDYVYIPLGGSQTNKMRTYTNLIVVFFLTGFWHGASWNFVVWGLFHGFFLIVERIGFENFLAKVWSPLANIYTLLVVMIGWVLFRSENFEDAFCFAKTLFHVDSNKEQINSIYSIIKPEVLFYLIFGIMSSLGTISLIKGRIVILLSNPKSNFIPVSIQLSSTIFYLSLLLLCTFYLIAGSYNPFIYYKF